MGIVEIINSGWFTLFFYLAIAATIYINRDKFEFQGKFVALYKTALGLEKMDELANAKSDKWDKVGRWLLQVGFWISLTSLLSLVVLDQFGVNIPFFIVLTGFGSFILFLIGLFVFRQIKKASHLGIIVGYLGMIAIVVALFYGLHQMVTQPEAAPTISPVLPGVDIPGSPIDLPLIIGFLVLFAVIVIHEFSHGVVARAHDIEVKSSGFVMFGPIPGAFVEPDEEKLEEEDSKIQNAIFSAGPFSNVITGFIAIIVLGLVMNPAMGVLFDNPQGFQFSQIDNGSAADKAGLQAGVTYNIINNQSVRSASEFRKMVQNVSPNQTFFIGNEREMHKVVATQWEGEPGKGRLGVRGWSTDFENEDSWWGIIFLQIREFFEWFIILSFGLGLANLLPIGPIDGGRMWRIACHKMFGEEKGDMVWKKSSVFFLLLIVVLLWPIIKATGLLFWEYTFGLLI